MKQVEVVHYSSASYDKLERFVSYFNQKEMILKAASNFAAPSILEIGKGTGFLVEYLGLQKLTVDTFDFDSDLKPTYIGDVRSITKAVHKKYNVVACFEVLEHIPFDDVPKAIDEIAKVNDGFLIISVPQMRLYMSFWFKFPILQPVSKYISIPYYKSHEFDGQHYWELGYKGYPAAKLKSIFSAHYDVLEEFTSPQMPYHRFFYLKRRIEKK